MNIDCIIVEDEPLAQERTQGYLTRLPFLNLVGTFDNAIQALVFLKTNKVDLMFLDINMGELSGIELLENTKISCEVIIASAYDEFALKGFELSVTDYLLKPYTFARFLQAVEKAINNLSKKEGKQEKKYVFIKTEYRLEKLMLSEVLYIEGMRDYRRIHTVDKKIMTLRTFTDLEREIPADIICRVHKSFMVSLDKIESVERDRIKIGETLIPISETYKKGFFRLINPSER